VARPCHTPEAISKSVQYYVSQQQYNRYGVRVFTTKCDVQQKTCWSKDGFLECLATAFGFGPFDARNDEFQWSYMRVINYLWTPCIEL
jgi:hypothetical protein